jgi:hypothetical protein
MVITLVIDFWELVKVTLKRGYGKGGKCVGEMVWELLGFVALVCVWVYFCCFSGKCFCQGLQEAWVVNSWYSGIVSGGE